MDRYDITERFSIMWKQSRNDGNKSQEYMARVLGVSKKTIQNWENGTSCPTQELGFAWFEALGLNPLPYYLQLLYPELSLKTTNEEDLNTMLFEMLKSLPSKEKLKLLYWFGGSHGSSPLCILELITAHLQTPLQDRLNIAHSVINNYKLASVKGTIKNPDKIQPDIDLLCQAYEDGLQAVLDGKENYCGISL